MVNKVFPQRRAYEVAAQVLAVCGHVLIFGGLYAVYKTTWDIPAFLFGLSAVLFWNASMVLSYWTRRTIRLQNKEIERLTAEIQEVRECVSNERKENRCLSGGSKSEKRIPVSEEQAAINRQFQEELTRARKQYGSTDEDATSEQSLKQPS